MPRIQSLLQVFIFLAAIFFIFALPSSGYSAGNKPEAAPAQDARMENFPEIDQMLGAMLMLGFRGSRLEPDDEFLNLLARGRVGGVILFDRDVSSNGERNIISPERLKELTAALRKAAKGPIFIGVDQEGGQVRRLKPQRGFMDLPSAQSMGQSSPEKTLETAEALGLELKSLGIDLDLAPVADVDTNPFNPSIGQLGRAFNSDAQIVARHALAFGQGLAKNGVAPVLKHFPGQGCAREDTHLGAADISRCWNPDVDLLPYAEIFQAGWPGAVMVGHVFNQGLDPNLPASLSRNIVTGLLRDGLGWHGVVISDDLQMKAASAGRELKETMLLAIEAGIDILLFGNNLEWDPELPRKVWTALRSLHDEGKVTAERVRQSWLRISALHAAYGAN